MAPELGRIGPIVIRTYSLILDLAIILGLAVLAWQGQRREGRSATWVDAGLGALIGGIILGRLGHVAIYWAYYSHHFNEALQPWRGGMDWHLAVIGGLIGLALVCRWRGLSFPVVASVIAVILPVSAGLIYTGCLMVSCGHGREVASLTAYPLGVALELPDLYGVIAPRLASQLYGVLWSGLVFACVILLIRRMKRPRIHLWPVLLLIGVGAFLIGFTRGDEIPMIGPLRLDQIMDLAIIILGLAMTLATVIPIRQRTLYGPVGFTRR